MGCRIVSVELKLINSYPVSCGYIGVNVASVVRCLNIRFLLIIANLFVNCVFIDAR